MSEAGAGAAADAASRIQDIQLDQKSIVRWSPEVEHERNVAIFDLLEANRFALLQDGFAGPYKLVLSLRESNLILDVAADGQDQAAELVLSMRPFRSVIKDYFLICDSYYQAIRGATPSRIEAIDMARRGLHNEGSELLRDALKGRVDMDHDTARRLFTLICVLHIRS